MKIRTTYTLLETEVVRGLVLGVEGVHWASARDADGHQDGSHDVRYPFRAFFSQHHTSLSRTRIISIPCDLPTRARASSPTI